MNLFTYVLTITYTDAQGRRATREVHVQAPSVATAHAKAVQQAHEDATPGLLGIQTVDEADKLQLLREALKEAQETLRHNKIDTGPLPGISQRIRYALEETL